jgi:hypothetical protein
MQAHVTAHSQAYRLRERMAQAKVQHGQEIRADLTGIGVTALDRGWFTARHDATGEVFFCSMGPIRLRRVAISGDGARCRPRLSSTAWKSLAGGPTTSSMCWSGPTGTCG